MFKKTKEKINDNQYFILFKKIWDNKRYKSLLLLFLYFIFFFVIISSLKTNYELQEPLVNDGAPTLVEKMNMWDNYINNYSYKLYGDNDKLLLEVYNDQGIINFSYNNKEYSIINGVIYLKKNDDLKKIEKLVIEELIIPIEKLNLNSIISYVKNIEAYSIMENTIQYQGTTEIFSDLDIKDMVVIVSGDNKLENVNLEITDEKSNQKINYKIEMDL